MKRLLLAALIFCACSPVMAAVTVSGEDPGGDIDTYTMWWKRVARSGESVRITGDCISACTFVVGLIPTNRICVGPRARLGIHMASTENGPNKRLTRWVQRTYYPQWINDWIKTKPPLTDDITWMTAKTLRAHFKACR